MLLVMKGANTRRSNQGMQRVCPNSFTAAMLVSQQLLIFKPTHAQYPKGWTPQ